MPYNDMDMWDMIVPTPPMPAIDLLLAEFGWDDRVEPSPWDSHSDGTCPICDYLRKDTIIISRIMNSWEEYLGEN